MVSGLNKEVNPVDVVTREFESLYNFFFKIKPVQKSILFYAEHEGYFSYFEGIINELTQNRKVPVSYVTSDFSDPILTDPPEYVNPFYIERSLPIFMRFVDSKVFVMTLTDLDKFYLKRSMKPVHYVYAFHAMVSTHMMYRKGAFDHYDSVLCTGPHQIKELKKAEEIYETPPKKLIEAGYYRLERIYNSYKSLQKKQEKAGDEKQDSSTILIAPSWGEKNILETCGQELIKILLEKGFRVIVRPHPETVRRFPRKVNSLEEKFGKSKKFQLERSVSTDRSLLVSDVLICDLSGVALEYSFGTERPVLFLDVPFKIKNPDYREIGIEPLEVQLRPQIGKVLSPDDLKDAPEALENLLKDRETYKEKIVKLRNKYVFNFGKSSKIGADHIQELAGK